ncbi:Vitamin B12-binding protein [Halomicronema hongdechloris C2206]|uniref:Vitamin B12-binding protein n=1 Tax=Halomicronema hongdechloris C2206 TaxID=1641165 RepID=A0A1Z3HND7_9CYAN|nr:Vitamin B12-binding protein [Halomicronema hongdechloris C2206]
MATLTAGHPQIISLQPSTLEQVWQDIRRVGQQLVGPENQVQTEAVITTLDKRIDHCRQQLTDLASRPRVVCIEWTDPLMAAGNWVPELVALAGGEPHLAEPGHHSPWLDWQQVLAVDPEVIVVMPCGYDLEQTLEAAQALKALPRWAHLTAVKTDRVYGVDGNQYFNRPGPRLVDSLEMLAELCHPERCQYGYEGQGWRRI